jgi:hypothetical protein
VAALSYQRAALTGTKPTYAAASASGDTIPGGGDGALHVKNGSAAAISVTVKVPGKTDFGLDQPDIVVSVPASEDRLIGPMRSGLVNAEVGAVEVTYSDVTSVTVAALAI